MKYDYQQGKILIKICHCDGNAMSSDSEEDTIPRLLQKSESKQMLKF